MEKSSLYTIKKVPISEYKKLVEFLDKHWVKNHALVKSKALLDFQHLNKEEGVYNFIVGENNVTGEYDAVFGYIPKSQYDSSLKDDNDYWGALWKRRDDIDNDEIKTLGFCVREAFDEMYPISSHSGLGLSKVAQKINKINGSKCGSLSQYYILNDKIIDYKIAANVNSTDITAPTAEDTLDVRWIEDRELETLNVGAYYYPYKTITYFKNRYVNHPIYKYRFLGAFDGEKIAFLLAVRKIEVNGSSVFRIVDALGELQGSIYYGLLKLLHEEQSEYFDFYNYGIPEEVFYKMGFRKLDTNGILIIPNYFEPFVQKNIEIAFAVKPKIDYVAFKGDSDQDRPSII